MHLTFVPEITYSWISCQVRYSKTNEASKQTTIDSLIEARENSLFFSSSKSHRQKILVSVPLLVNGNIWVRKFTNGSCDQFTRQNFMPSAGNRLQHHKETGHQVPLQKNKMQLVLRQDRDKTTHHQQQCPGQILG